MGFTATVLRTARKSAPIDNTGTCTLWQVWRRHMVSLLPLHRSRFQN